MFKIRHVPSTIWQGRNLELFGIITFRKAPIFIWIKDETVLSSSWIWSLRNWNFLGSLKTITYQKLSFLLCTLLNLTDRKKVSKSFKVLLSESRDWEKEKGSTIVSKNRRLKITKSFLDVLPKNQKILDPDHNSKSIYNYCFIEILIT